ncbi:MAG: hypothetical protein Q4C76_00200 [Bacillota bacterium]|nr:hypothetical protein [Bacillota bacterium]
MVKRQIFDFSSGSSGQETCHLTIRPNMGQIRNCVISAVNLSAEIEVVGCPTGAVGGACLKVVCSEAAEIIAVHVNIGINAEIGIGTNACAACVQKVAVAIQGFISTSGGEIAAHCRELLRTFDEIRVILCAAAGNKGLEKVCRHTLCCSVAADYHESRGRLDGETTLILCGHIISAEAIGIRSKMDCSRKRMLCCINWVFNGDVSGINLLRNMEIHIIVVCANGCRFTVDQSTFCKSLELFC